MKAGVDASGQARRVRRGNVGNRRRRAGRGLLGALSGLRLPESPPAAPRRVHQRRTAARVPRAGTSAGLLRHRSRDRRAGRSAPDRSARAADAEPAAADASGVDQPNRQWRKYFPMGAEKIGWSKRHPTGDPTAGPIKRGLGCAANIWAGAGNPQTRAACEILADGSVIDAHRHAGHRHRHAHARRDDHRRDDGAAARGACRRPSATPTIRSRRAAAAASPSDRSRRPCASPPKTRAMQLFAKVAPSLGVDPTTLVAKAGRIAVEGRHLEVHDVARRLQAARDRADQRARRVGEGPLGRRHERRAVRRRRSRHRDRRHARQEDRLRAGLRA